MENSVHEEPVKTKIPEGIGERVWKRVVRHLDSPTVVEQWDKAVLRIAREARPEYTEEQLEAVRDRWHLLARGMGVAASTVDIAIAGVFTAKGVDTIAGIRRFFPADIRTMSSPAKQTRDNALRQIAAGSPLIAIAGATVAIRPAKLWYSFGGKVIGAGGERIARIVNAITQKGRSDILFFGAGVARQAKS